MVNENLEPVYCGSYEIDDGLSTHISPPISSTSCFDMVMPSPVPPNFRVVEPSACENDEKISFNFSFGMPIPVSSIEKSKVTYPLSFLSSSTESITFPS